MSEDLFSDGSVDEETGVVSVKAVIEALETNLG
jgi:hypothetical protein